MLLAVVRRTMRGMSPFDADRQHLHHRLLNLGHSDRSAVLLMYLWAALFSGLVVGLSVLRIPLVWFALITVVAIAALMLATAPKLRFWTGNGKRGRTGRSRHRSADPVSATRTWPHRWASRHPATRVPARTRCSRRSGRATASSTRARPAWPRPTLRPGHSTREGLNAGRPAPRQSKARRPPSPAFIRRFHCLTPGNTGDLPLICCNVRERYCAGRCLYVPVFGGASLPDCQPDW